MTVFLLLIIYMAFISLGLPDSLLGVAWPLIRKDFGSPLAAAGLVSMFIAGSTIVSSFASGFLHKRMDTEKITLFSCLMTSFALIGFALAPSFIWLLILAIPLGLGAGSVDAALNNYVASHFKSHHMSWLHCFWGVGATLGPILMSRFITLQGSWRNGYFCVSMIQLALAAILFFTLPLWRRNIKVDHGNNETLVQKEAEKKAVASNTSYKKVSYLKIKGVKLSLVSFLFYCGVEATMGLWGSSYLIGIKELSAATAAQWVSLFFGGITAGRLITGFVTFKVSNRALILLGQTTAMVGALLILLPLPVTFSLFGFIMIGLGCAPIFPCMLHETPIRFGKENSQTIMGYQMALAYTGTTFLPPVLGLVSAHTTLGLFPYFIFACIIFMLIGSERIFKLQKMGQLHC